MLTNNNTPLEKRVDLNLNEKRMWESLIRVNSITADKIGLVLPGWNANRILYFDIKKMPEPLLEEIRKGMNPYYRFHALVNIGAEKQEDIYIVLSDK